MSNQPFCQSPSLPDEEENCGLEDGYRKRSSILKITKSPTRPVLQDLDINQQEEDTKRRASRRVSFADTYQIKEYLTDSVSLSFWNETQEKPIPHSDESTSGSSEGDPSMGSRIQGLETLLSGKIHSSDSDVLNTDFENSVPLSHILVENPSLGKKRKGNLVPNQGDSRTLHASTASTITASYYMDKKRRVLQPIEVQLPMADNSDPSSSRHLSNFGDKTILIADDMDMTYKDCTITKSYIHDVTVETDSLALNRTCYTQDAMEFTYIEPKTMHATLHEIVGSQFGDKTVMFSGDYEGDMSVTCFEKSFVAPNNDLEQSLEEYSDNSESGVGEKYAHEVLKNFKCNPINTIPDSSVSSRFGLELVDKSTLVHPSSSQIFRKKFISPDLSDGMECDRTLTKLCPVSYQDKETMLKEMAQVESSFRDICGSMCNSNGKSDKKETQSSSIASMSTMTTATNLASASFYFPNPVASRSEYVKSKPLSGEETMKNAVEKSRLSVDMEPTECVSRNIILVNEEEAPISSCKEVVMQTNSARCTIEDMEETQCATEGINFPLTCRSKTWNSNAKGITIIFDSENADVDSTSVIDGTIMVALPESTISNEAEWDSSSGKGIQQSKIRTNVDHNSEVVHSVLPLDSTNQTPNESLIGEATSNLLKEAELALTLLDKNNKSLEKDFQPTTLSSELNNISADVSSNVLLSNLNNKKMDVKLLLLSHDEKNEVTELSRQTEPKTTIFPAALNCPKKMISHSLSYSTKNDNASPEAHLNESRVGQLCPVGVPVPNSEIIKIDEQLTENTDAFSRKRPLVQSMSDSNHGTLLKSKTCDDRKCKEQKLDEAVTRSDVSHTEVLEANAVKGNIVNMSSCGSTLQGVITTQDHSSCDIISQECSKQIGSFVSIPCSANEEVVSVAEVNSCSNKLLKNENVDLRVHDTSVKIHLNEDRNNASVNRQQGFLNTKPYENEPTKEAPNCENGSVLHEKSVSDLAEFLPDNGSFNLLNQSSVKPFDKTAKIPLEKTACKTHSNQDLTSKVATDQLKVNTCQNLTFGSCRELYSDIERCNRRHETTNLSTSVLVLNDNNIGSPLQVKCSQQSSLVRSNTSIVQSPWSLSKQRCTSYSHKKSHGNDIGSKRKKTKCRVRLTSHNSSTAAANFTPTKDSAFRFSEDTITQGGFKPVVNSTMVGEALVMQGSPEPEKNVSVFTDYGSPGGEVSRVLLETTAVSRKGQDKSDKLNATPACHLFISPTSGKEHELPKLLPLASDITVASAVMSAEIFRNYRPAANEGKSNEVVCPATVDVVNEAHDLSTDGGKPEVEFDRQHLTASVQQSTESQQLVVQQTDLAHHSNNSKSTRFKENVSNKNHEPHEINLLTSSIDHILSSISSQDVANAANCIEMKHVVQKITQYENSNIGLANSRKQNLAEEMPALHVEYAEAMCLEKNAVKETTNYETVDDMQKLNATTTTMEQLRGEKTSNVKSERDLPKDVAVPSKEIDSANSMACKLNHSTSFVQQSDVTIADFQLIRKDQSFLSPCENFANDISQLSPVDDLLDQYSIPLAVQDDVSLLHDPDKISRPAMSILSESQLEVAAVATDKSREGGCLESLNESKFYDDDIVDEGWMLEELTNLLKIAGSTLASVCLVNCKLQQMTSDLPSPADFEVLEDIEQDIALKEKRLEELNIEKEQVLRSLETTQMIKTNLEAEIKASKSEIMHEEAELVKLEARVKELEAQDALSRSLKEGNLEKADSSGVSLTYMWGTLRLDAVYGEELPRVNGDTFQILPHEVRSVSLTVCKAALSPMSVLAHNMVLKAVDRSLFDSIHTSRELYKVVNHVSLLSAHSRWLTEDVDELHYQHSVDIGEDSITVEFCSIEVHTLFNILFPLVPGNYPEEVIQPTYKQVLGKNLEADVMEVLESVKPGGAYLKKMVEAVDNLLKETAKFAEQCD